MLLNWRGGVRGMGRTGGGIIGVMRSAGFGSARVDGATIILEQGAGLL